MFNEDPDWHLHLHIILRAKKSLRGKFFDRTFDRLVDGVIFVIIVADDPQNIAFIGIIALFTTYIASYVREVAENIGIKCKIGVFSRDLRLLILGVMLALSAYMPHVIITMLYFLIVFNVLTFIQRILYILKNI